MKERTTGKAGPSHGQLVIRILIRVVIFFGLWGYLLFWAAGTIFWVRGWIHLGLWALTVLVNCAVLFAVNPGIIVTRMEMKRPTEPLDRIIALVALPMTLGTPVLAGLDAVRYQLTSMPLWFVFVGLALHVAGDFFMVWSAAVNPFLEKIVRIQKERDHHVITTGPYSIVRHPMYLGTLLLMAGTPLVLGSWWTFAPMGGFALLLVIRTVWEDRFLRRELPGYEEYARETQYRLLPGVW